MVSQAGDRRLSTWAEIAAYISRDVRTARRYETERGLPVRRLPGSRSTVFAHTRELDAWRSGELHAAEGAIRTPDPPDRAAPAPRSSVRRAGVLIGATAALALAVVLVFVALRPAREPAPAASPTSRALYRDGVYAWSRRTPDGLARAIDAFTQAIVRDPGFAQAYAGLADAYDLAPEFGHLTPALAYPRAKGAAERALALDPSLAAAHRALAFVEFWWEGRVDPAMAEFRRALELDPRSAQTHHWYANALAARGDARALTEFDAAVALSPSTPVMADRAWGLAMLGRPAEALAALAELRRLDPAYPPAGLTDVMADQRLGRDADRLRALRTWAGTRGDAVDAAVLAGAEAAYARGGRSSMLQALAEREEARLARGVGDAFTTAEAEAERGQTDAALILLRRAKAEHSPMMLSLETNPDFASLRADPRFGALLP